MSNSFLIGNAKTCRSKCKKCKQYITQNDLRFGVGSSTGVKSWYHLSCFPCKSNDPETFLRDEVIDDTKTRLLKTRRCFNIILKELKKRPIRKKIKRSRVDTTGVSASRKNTKTNENVSTASATATQTGTGTAIATQTGTPTPKNDIAMVQKLFSLLEDKEADVVTSYERYNNMTESQLLSELCSQNVQVNGDKTYLIMWAIATFGL